MITVFVPPNASITHVFDINGRAFQARVADDGKVVIDVTPSVFLSLLMGRQNGKAWEDANKDNSLLWERMKPGSHAA